MTFFYNPCSPQYINNNQQVQFNRKVLFFTILFEICLVLMLRVISSFKNHDLSQIKKQLQQKKYSQAELIQQTINTITNLNDKEAKQVNSVQNQNKLRLGTNIPILQQNNSSSHSQSSQGEEHAKNQQPANQSPQSLIKSYTDLYRRNFINLYRLKLGVSQASQFLNIVIGPFLIAATASISFAPIIQEIVLAGVHCFGLLIHIGVNLALQKQQSHEQMISKLNQPQRPHAQTRDCQNFSKEMTMNSNTPKAPFSKDSQIQAKSSQIRNEHEAVQSCKKILQSINQQSKGLEKDKREWQHQSEVEGKNSSQNKRQILRWIRLVNLTVEIVLFSTVLVMLTVFIVEMKKSYFNIEQKKCQRMY